MKRTIKGELNSRSIRNMASHIRQYGGAILPDKIERFIRLLGQSGIETAWQTIKQPFSNYVYFEFNYEMTSYGYRGMVLAIEKGQILKHWSGKDGEEKTAFVSPLLLSEFGSGLNALEQTVLQDGTKVGQGTFPNQTHAFDKNGWWWNENGEWHHSYGYKPTRPMFEAYNEMLGTIEAVAKTVFG